MFTDDISIRSKIKYFSGTSGLVLPYKNKLLGPPEFHNRTRLEYYASLFNSIEINSSFYKVPQAATVIKWASLVPDDFHFTYKLWKEITHSKDDVINKADISRFVQVISGAGLKSGCLLVQFPPGFTINKYGKLEQILNGIRQADPEGKWKIATEFRHRSWYEPEVYDLLESFGAGLVVHDMPASGTPMIEHPEPFVYLRFHGPNGGYRGTYADDFLQEYAYYIRDWLEEGKTIYCYFNNTMGEAVNNVRTLDMYVHNLFD